MLFIKQKQIIAALVTVLVLTSFFTIYHETNAGVLINLSDTMSRLARNVYANHEIAFRLTLGTNVTENETITVAFSSGFAANLNGIDCGDIDLLDDGVQENLNNEAGGCVATATEWGAAVSSGVLTLTAPSTAGTYIDGSSDVVIRIGTNTTEEGTGNEQIRNPLAAGQQIIRVAGTFGDSKTLAISIVNLDQVGVTAIVGAPSPPGGGLPCPLAPIIFNLTVAAVTENTATINWETDQSSTTLVNYGLNDAYGTSVYGISFVTSHTVTLVGLMSGTTYHFQAVSANWCGNTTATADFNFTTLSGPDTTSPEISNVQVINLTPTSATVTWDTSELADSAVQYGQTEAYDLGVISSPDDVLHHSIDLTGLTPDTLYHFRVISADPVENIARSFDYTFRTPPLPTCTIDCDQITYDLYIINPNYTERHMGTLYAKVTTLSPNRYYVNFEDRGLDIDYNDVEFILDTNSCSGITIEEIDYSADWHHEVRLRLSYSGLVREDLLLWPDSAAAVGATRTINVFDYPDICTADTASPTISDITVINLAERSAEAVWRTDEPATSIIQYGTTTSYELGSITISDLTLVHDIALLGLEPGTIYHFRVISTDAWGNTTTSSDQVFMTPADTTPPANVTNFTATATPERTVLLSWTNPTDPDFAGVIIRRSFDSYPTSPGEGELIFVGLAESFIDTNFTPADYNRPIYYTIFAFDTVENYSSGAVAQTQIVVLVTLDFTAWPEKRWPRQGNWGTLAKVDLRTINTTIVRDTDTVRTSSAGLGTASYEISPGSYDVALKGLSHLRKVLKNIPLALAGPNRADFTEGGTASLLAGDCHPSADNLVNSLDLSVMLNDLNLDEEISDLNRDYQVNSLDINILLANLMKWGEL